MANSKSADKRARQNRSRYELKHAQRSIVRTSVKNVLSAVESKDKKVKDIFKDSQAKIDRLADLSLIHI